MLKVSVFIITLNEQDHIKRALESTKLFSQVVVVDCGSTDDTIDICKQFTNVKLIHQKWLGFSKQKQFALENCSNEWAFNLDADEELTPEIIAEIKLCMASNKYSGARFPRREFFLGELTHKWTKNNRFLRFVKTRSASYNDKLVHESLQVNGEIYESNACFLHYGEQSLFIKVEKINKYALLRAKEKSSKGKKSSITKMLLAPILAFIKSYILKRNFLMGRRGLAGSAIVSFYAFLKEAMLYEENRKN